MTNQAAQQLGKLGGKKTIELHGSKLMSENGKKGMASRWKNHVKKEKKAKK